MARAKSTSLWPFASKKKSAPKKTGFGRYVLMFLAFMTGSGSIAGMTEYDWLRAAGRLLLDRVTSHHSGSTDAGDGAIRVYFTHPEQAPETPGDIAHALVGYIDATKESLDVATFELDNHLITDALVRAVRRGVKVRCVTETNYINASGITALRGVGVTIVDDQRDSALMHNKFMVFDRKAVWTGSMNFTENCAYRNNNNGLCIDSTQLAENYATKFAWMFEQHKFGAAPSKADRIPNPVITLRDGTQLENYFSTHDHPAEHIVATVKLAKKSVHFMAFSFTHKGIGQAMLAKARDGIEVGGVFEKTQTATGTSSQYFAFQEAGLPVFLDGNPRNMHHKVIVIDGEIVIAGSFNFSESADRSNDENLVIIYNRKIAELFEEEYQKVLATAKQARR